MDKRKLFERSFAIFVIAMLLVIVAAAFINPAQSKKILYPAEVRNYQGQDLSSISDFVDNTATQPVIDTATYNLQITGLVNQPVNYTYNQILNNFQSYQKVVTLQCVEGWRVTILWEGFLVSDLIKEAGVSPNAVALIFHAADGYTTSLPLDYVLNNKIMVAYKMNNVTLPPERGFPFQLVAESQYGYKWIKWLTSIELTSNPDYKGTYERAGYPNNATIRVP